MKVLKSFTLAASKSGGGTRHDWNTLCDGAIRTLKAGEDFKGKKHWFAVQCRLKAKQRGLRLEVRGHKDKSHDYIEVQFINQQAEQTEQTPAKSKK